MKTKIIFIIFIALILGVFASSCDKNKKKKKDKDPAVVFGDIKIDASSTSTWHYYSLSEAKIIGTGEENEADNASWFARTDWDIAFQRYLVRTNSGSSSTTDAKGGVFTMNKSILYADVKEVPANAVFIADAINPIYDMVGGIKEDGKPSLKDISRSKAEVASIEMKADGTPTQMPPKWLKNPLYIFRTADAKQNYLIDFISYANEKGKSGHISFNMKKL